MNTLKIIIVLRIKNSSSSLSVPTAEYTSTEIQENKNIKSDDSPRIHYLQQAAKPELQKTTSMARGIHILVFH